MTFPNIFRDYAVAKETLPEMVQMTLLACILRKVYFPQEALLTVGYLINL